MNVIVVCHTESGFVSNGEVIYDKKAVSGVTKGVQNLTKISKKYSAKITFALMPEFTDIFPQNVTNEIGLHIHPGWVKYKHAGFSWYVGDKYLREHCETSVNSTVLKDYPFKEQANLINVGRDCLRDKFGVEPKVFVSGRWSDNNDTIRALIEGGFTHDCSAPASQKATHFDWSKLPRICMPYHPSNGDYQERGNLPLLIVPISQIFLGGNVTPEIPAIFGVSALKACFLEYYLQGLPLFHICLHSPSMTDEYFCSVMDELLAFISRYDIQFKFASETNDYGKTKPKTCLLYTSPSPRDS